MPYLQTCKNLLAAYQCWFLSQYCVGSGEESYLKDFEKAKAASIVSVSVLAKTEREIQIDYMDASNKILKKCTDSIQDGFIVYISTYK